ncbi:MAG: ABC transporter substrate-binding protein [bacterium]|nr:ABC transporter substrate-binding protein [bacterium]
MMRLRLIGIFTVLILLASACGGGDSEPAADDSAQEPETQPVEEEAAPSPTDAPESTAEPEDAGPEATPSAAETSESTEEAPEPDAPGPTPEPTPTVLTDSFRGVTAEAIKIGIVIIDIAMIGRSNGDVEAKWQAVIDDVNANGGVLGRRLEPVYVTYSLLGDVATEAACVELTQDEQVFAAMGPLLSNLNCFTDVNETIFISAFTISQEEFDRSKAVAIGPGALPARSAVIGVEALVGAGVFDGPVAVHVAADTGSERDHYVDALVAAGIEVVSETAATDTGGDIAASEAEMQAFAQRWQADGAEIIFGVGSGAVLGIVAGLDRGPYRPAVVFVGPIGLDIQLYRDLGYSTDSLEGAIALGSLGFEDLALAGEPSVTACIERFEAASGETVNISPEEGEVVNLNTTIWACQAVEVFTQIATAAGADLTNDSFRAAAERGLSLDVTANSAASVGAGKFDISDGAPILLVFDPPSDAFVPMN